MQTVIITFLIITIVLWVVYIAWVIYDDKQFTKDMNKRQVKFDAEMDRINKQNTGRFASKPKFEDTLVKCDKCKYLLEKQDAYRGESTVENQVTVKELGLYGDCFKSYSTDERIVEHFYCQRCKQFGRLSWKVLFQCLQQLSNG